MIMRRSAPAAAPSGATPEISIRRASAAPHQIEAAVEPAGAAGQDDDRVGALVAGRARAAVIANTAKPIA